MIQIREYAPDDEVLRKILARGEAVDQDMRARVEEILAAVRAEGDAALCRLSEAIDGVALTPETIRVGEEEFAAAQETVGTDFVTAVALARVNIREFHQYQRRAGYVHDDGDGVRLSKRVLPLARVGLCCPAKAAPLFSSLLMNAIPAQVAGVGEIHCVVPPRADGTVDPHILVAANMLGIDAVYRVGGAHAVGALAFGTGTVPPVDKIVGPGSAWVQTAKRLVSGRVGIDSFAGDSEIVIIADATARARYIAADLVSQLEHGGRYGIGVLFTDSRDLAAAVRIELERQLKALSRREAIESLLGDYAAIYLCRSLDDALEGANRIAPEHLEIVTADPHALLPGVVNAGAVFLGPWSTEPVGDYFAGTNHVLPTNGAARFASSLSVYDFVKDISVVEYTAERLRRTGRHILRMAEIEGLTAHANAVRVRLEDL